MDWDFSGAPAAILTGRPARTADPTARAASRREPGTLANRGTTRGHSTVASEVSQTNVSEDPGKGLGQKQPPPVTGTKGMPLPGILLYGARSTPPRAADRRQLPRTPAGRLTPTSLRRCQTRRPRSTHRARNAWTHSCWLPAGDVRQRPPSKVGKGPWHGVPAEGTASRKAWGGRGDRRRGVAPVTRTAR
ncbi:hypothetical protein HJG60_010412 [Phyllostomus discolor]|uniref:Uncharacterized protein n=1 Tax=Phyllostomus discolor TaxID=89673 RepID=A0A834EK04_9CHIR|nr:hypothetical protein HJG60_010412 [Phyllostomus discolor]